MRFLSDDIINWIHTLPKAETHLHMEGAVSLEIVQRELSGRFPEKPEFWRDDFRFESFDVFSELFAEVAGAVFKSVDAYAECAETVFGQLMYQNCRYVETSIALGALVRSELDGAAVIRSILDAAPDAMEVRVFIGMRHNEYVGLGKEIVEDAIGWTELAGFDLHGPEYLPLESWTADVWQRAREAGKFNKAHAGEFMPASFVKRCVEELGVTRIEHGVRAVEDSEVLEFLVQNEITLDVCPISNVKLGVDGITSLADHPIRRLFDAGVKCTVNTDDPFFFGNRLIDEYAALYQYLGFSQDELRQLAENGIACQFDSYS